MNVALRSLVGVAVVSAGFVGAPGVAAATMTPAVDTTTVVQGVVRAEGYRAQGTVPSALVEFRQGSRTFAAVTDAEGRYRIQGARPGPARMTVSHVALHPARMELEIPARGPFTLDLELRPRVLLLPGVVALGAPLLNRPVRPLPRGDRSLLALALSGLGSSSGIAESGLTGFTNRGVPGNDEPDRTRALFTRGSTVDARLILLDGAPVLTPFHVAGLVPAFDGSLLGAADLYLGGAPSRFDGGLSYLLDVDTRTPRRDRVHMEGAVDGLSARTVVEGPLPLEGGVLAGGRFLHGLPTVPGAGSDLPYGYRDLLVRAELRPGENRSLRVTGYANREGVRLDPQGAEAELLGNAEWGNEVLSARYLATTEQWLIEAGGSVSRYRSVLPISWNEALLARGTSHRSRGALDLGREAGPGEVRVGFSADQSQLEYRLETGRRSEQLFVPPGTESVRSTVLGGYLEWEGALNDGIRFRGGVRANQFLEEEQLVLGPRASLEVLLSDRATLTLSAGRYHQAVPASSLTASPGEDESTFMDWNPRLAVASAGHLVVGLAQELDGGVRVDLSGFMKRYEGLDGSSSAGAALGGTRASGTDLRVTRQGESFQGWLGYALTWFWEEEGVSGSSRFEGRQLLSAGAHTVLAGDWEMGATLAFGAGLPLSAIEVAGAPSLPALPEERRPVNVLAAGGARTVAAGADGAPLALSPSDEFLRVDLELSRSMTPMLGGRATHLRPYLRVVNALHRRDALFHYFDGFRGEELRPIAERPFLPLFGLEWRF